MRQITKNFRLGFGSFVDKKVMPFVDPRKEKQEQPCPEGCAPTYGFHHQMSLTTNTEKFAVRLCSLLSGLANTTASEGSGQSVDLWQSGRTGRRLRRHHASDRLQRKRLLDAGSYRNVPL